MEPSDASKTYYVSKILEPILRKPFGEYREKEPQPFEDFMQTLPVPLTAPPIDMNRNEFVEHAEPCLVREAFQSVRAQAVLFDVTRTITCNFDISPSRNSKFDSLEFRGIKKYQLNVTRKYFPPGIRAKTHDEDWSTKLVVVLSGSMHNPTIQLGFVSRALREKLCPGRSRATRLCLDLWVHRTKVVGNDPNQRVAELTPFMSVYRQCWALSILRSNPVRPILRSSLWDSILSPDFLDSYYTRLLASSESPPLLDAFLSLPAESYRSNSHNFHDRHDELLQNLNSTQRRVVEDFAYTVISNLP